MNKKITKILCVAVAMAAGLPAYAGGGDRGAELSRATELRLALALVGLFCNMAFGPDQAGQGAEEADEGGLFTLPEGFGAVLERTAEEQANLDARLIRAAQENNGEEAQRLLNEGANMYAMNINNVGVFDIAFVNNAGAVMEALLRAGIALDRLPNNNGRTPLHYAATYGLENYARELIDQRVNLNALDRFGYTPLMRALENGQIGVFVDLLQAGAEVIDVLDINMLELKKWINVRFGTYALFTLLEEFMDAQIANGSDLQALQACLNKLNRVLRLMFPPNSYSRLDEMIDYLNGVIEPQALMNSEIK